MDVFEFLVLSFCNLGLIFWIVKRQGLTSVEGYCAAFLGMAVFSDNVQLLFDYSFQPWTMVLGADEFGLRAYPTIVHIVALIVLIAGLRLGNPKPEPIKRNLSNAELRFVAHTGLVLVLLGLFFATVTVYLTHAFTAANFFRGLDTFRGGDPGSTGGFFYRGADIAVFGMALILPSLRKKGPFLLVLLAMMLVSFFLRANKGGLELPIFWTALAMYTYSPNRFRSLVKPKIVLACLVIALLGIGIKVELMTNKDQPWALETLTDSIVGPVQGRWGDQGLYRGYCQFIELLPRYHYLFEGYREGMYALTEAWVPRAVNSNKKPQPSEGLGFMIHADAHAYREETPSIELVGSVYADNGFYSLTAYLLVVGFLLGVLRRYAAGRGSNLQWHISYLCFALFQGLSAESGIVGIIYTFLLTFAITGFVHLFVIAAFKHKIHGGAFPHHLLVPDRLHLL